MNNDALIATDYRVPFFKSATNFILDLIILSTLINPAQYFQIELALLVFFFFFDFALTKVMIISCRSFTGDLPIATAGS